jgi:hypothetical protein
MPQKGFGILEFEFSVFPPSKLPQFWGLGLGKSAEGKPKTENSGFPRFLIMNKLESALLFTLYIYRERAREREREREKEINTHISPFPMSPILYSESEKGGGEGGQRERSRQTS